MLCTLITKEYRTVSSMLLIFRCRISRERFSNKLTIFTIWPGILRDTVLKTTFDPEIFASTSATGELQDAPSSLIFSCTTIDRSDCGVLGCSNGFGLGPGLGLMLLRLFFDSNDCKTCCISLMNSITPPMIEAWSPYHIRRANENKSYLVYHWWKHPMWQMW